MDITEQLSKLTLQEHDPTEQLAESILKLTLEEQHVTEHGPSNVAGSPPSPPSITGAFAGVTPRAAIVFNQIASGQYAQLARIDEQVDSRCKEVLLRLDSLASPDCAVDQNVLRFLEDEDRWLETTLQKVNLFVAANESVKLLKTELIGRLESIIDAVDCYKLILTNRPPPDLHEGADIYDTTHCHQDDLGKTHRETLLSCLNVLILNLFGHVTHRWCNFTLKMMHTILQEAYTRDGHQLNAREIKILENFPHDLRSVRDAFGIEAKTVTWAACPKCNCTYKPTMDGNVDIYPSQCDWKEFPTSQPCGEPLMTSKIVEGESIRYPKRPFVVQDFDAFVAGLLCRPGIEDLLDQGTVLLNREELVDIKDGSGVQDLPGPDGHPFLDSLQRSELRLVWSLSVDWFNPHTNKIAGKHVLTGSIAMACLNLPPSLRYKPEFMYLHSVMPTEPTLDQSNHYLKPIITQVNKSYEKGVKYNKTYKHREGRQTRSAIAVFVNDLPGGKKVAQMASHSSKSHFCSLCTLHRDHINQVDPSLWIARDSGILRDAAFAWKNAKSKAERDRIFGEYGVRWSELWRLTYYDPVKMLVIDGMHNLFEGLVQFHCRHVLGINEVEAESDEIAPTQKEVDLAKKILGSATSSDKAKDRLKVNVLKAVCRERDLLPDQPGVRLTKKALLNLLQNSPDNETLNEAEVRIEAVNLAALEAVVGPDYVDEVEAAYKNRVGDDGVNREELGLLHAALRSTQRPTWQRGPPLNFGCAAHGKLKADQWRSAIEFDVPTFLAQIWSYSDSEVVIDERKNRRRKLLHSTMLLSTAIQSGTSDITSQAHVTTYTQYMQAYLESLLELYPSFQLKPNHHGALHIGPFLLRFGPMRGWWMYPFERIIGILQKTNTNSKLGQMEGTMLKSFCAAANLKAVLRRGRDIPTVRECASQLDKVSQLFGPDTNFPDALAEMERNPSAGGGKSQQIDPAIYAAMHLKEGLWKSRISGWATPESVVRYRRRKFRGFEFTTYTESRSLGSVFFQPDDSAFLVPGRIQDIFAVETLGENGVKREDFFCVMKRNRGSPQPIPCCYNMSTVFEDFGACLWSSNLSEQVDVVPFTQQLYHLIGRPWSEGMVVLKPMDRAFGKLNVEG